MINMHKQLKKSVNNLKGDDKMGKRIKAEVGDFLEHKDGTYSQVMMFARNEDTDETMIIYKNLKSGSVWTIPVSKFTDDHVRVIIKGSDLIENGYLELSLKSIHDKMSDKS